MHEKVKNINLNFISGNDYNSSIFRKGKKTCFKVMQYKAAFTDMFRLLGDHLDPIELLPSIEQFICQFYLV